MFNSSELLKLTSRDFILGNSSQDEQVSFINDQIADPFDSGDTNYYKKLRRTVESDDELDEIIKDFIVRIMDVYPKLTIDVDDYDQHLDTIFPAIYRFFVKNARKMMRMFIREFIFREKNRKVLVGAFSGMKIPSYPKEQYGKKDYYILVTKLPQIVDEIFDNDDISIKQYLDYIERSDSSPVYTGQIRELLDRDIISENGLVEYMYKKYKKSDAFRGDLNKLEMDITKNLIIPYLEENGMMSVRIPPVEEIPEPVNDDEEDTDD